MRRFTGCAALTALLACAAKEQPDRIASTSAKTTPAVVLTGFTGALAELGAEDTLSVGPGQDLEAIKHAVAQRANRIKDCLFADIDRDPTLTAKVTFKLQDGRLQPDAADAFPFVECVNELLLQAAKEF